MAVAYSCMVPLGMGFARTAEIQVTALEEAGLLAQCVTGNIIPQNIPYKDIVFDGIVAGRLDKSNKLFHGWANASLATLRTAKLAGMKTILERQSAHASVQKRLTGALDSFTEERMIAEYAEADRILVPSRLVEESFLQADPSLRNKLVRIPLGVDLQKFSKIAHLKHPFRLLFTAGNNFDRKGGLALVKAWELARRRSRTVREGSLWIVGEVPRGYLGEGVNPLGWLGEEDYVRTVQESDALVLPSLEEGFGLVCLTPETEIFTESGLESIGTVKPGDKVLSHSGTFRSVSQTFRRPYDGEYYRITAWGLNTPVEITPNHPLLGVKRVKKRYGKYGRRWDLAPLEWITAEELQVGDAVHFPLAKPNIGPRVVYDLAVYGDHNDDFFVWNRNGYSPITGSLVKVRRKTELDENFANFLGWYVAEGYGNGGTFNLAFNISERPIAETIGSLLERRFGLQCRLRHQHGKGITLYGSSLTVKNFLESKCGIGSKRKRIPPEVLYNRDTSVLDAFVEGYYAGDGSRQGNRHSALTASNRLGGDLIIALTRLGRKPALCRFVNEQRTECLQLDYHEDNSNFRHSNKSWSTTYGDLLFLVKSKETMSGKTDVCNLQVEVDNTYVTMAGTVHNCLESMACARPVIVSDRVGAKDCIVDGREGYIVPVGDAAKLAHAIVALADNPGRRMEFGEQARRSAAKFSWQKYAESYLELVGSLLQ